MSNSEPDEAEFEAHKATLVTVSCASVVHAMQNGADGRYGSGSSAGRTGNRDIQRQEAAVRIDRDYLAWNTTSDPIFSKMEFTTRYSMSRELYETIREDVCSVDPYFVQSFDAASVAGSTTDQKLTSAFRQIYQALSADAVVEYVRLQLSTNIECLKRFCRAAVNRFEGEWLRHPNTENIKSNEKSYNAMGFPGCLGASFSWENSPVAWQGQFKANTRSPRSDLKLYTMISSAFGP